MTRHKHADLIHEWAEGATIQGRADANMEWLREMNPGWYQDWEYRIEPRTVKPEGWVAIYKYSSGVSHLYHYIYAYKDDAKNDCPSATDIIKIGWEEEE